MINWFWKYNPLMHRLPVLMALLASFMFVAGPPLAGPTMAGSQGAARSAAAKLLAPQQSASKAPQQSQNEQKSPTGEEIPHFEPAYNALAQVAPLQLFLYQPDILPVIIPLVEIAEQVTASVPDLGNNSYHRTLFRHIISPNAP